MERARLTTGIGLVAVWAAGLGAALGWHMGDEPTKESAKTVTVFRDEDCGRPAIARIKEVAAKLGVDIRVVEVVVTTDEQAQRHRFLGSPTVQIGGQDIDPKVRSRTSFGLG
jgi:hypothetical protein